MAQGRESRQQEAPADSGGPASRRMVKRLKDRRGKRQYRRRKGMLEPAFGWVKQVLGFRQFSLRGLKKVQGEWSLVTLALNLRRMAAGRWHLGKNEKPDPTALAKLEPVFLRDRLLGSKNWE